MEYRYWHLIQVQCVILWTIGIISSRCSVWYCGLQVLTYVIQVQCVILWTTGIDICHSGAMCNSMDYRYWHMSFRCSVWYCGLQVLIYLIQVQCVILWNTGIDLTVCWHTSHPGAVWLWECSYTIILKSKSTWAAGSTLDGWCKCMYSLNKNNNGTTAVCKPSMSCYCKGIKYVSRK